MAGRKSDFTLPTNTLDELFSTQEERDDAKLSKIRDIPLELIDDFPDHPFKVRDDEDMIQLVESVKERGVITPATVRQKEDGRYELISGHRRKRACELAGFEALRCEVVDLDRDAATVLMVESNYQRSQILPSEKAFAYKMRLDALSRQGKRTDLTSDPVGGKWDGKETAQMIGEQSGDSQTQVRRYIRLTNLVPELLDLVDEGKIKMRPAVELSYLDEDSQRAVVDEIDLNQCTPSHDQTIRMRKFFTDGKLTPEVVSAIMGEEKPNQREKIVLRGDKVRSLIPKNIPVADFVRCYEPVFLYLMAQKDIVSKRTETSKLKTAIESGKRRIQDLDKLIERIYEDQVLGNISAERYARMSVNYENEQRTLINKVAEDEKKLACIEQTSLDLKTLLKVLRSSTSFEELTPTIVNALIRRIEVHNNDKSSGHCYVKVDIYFTAIGLIDIPTEDEIKSLMAKIKANPQEYRLTA